MTTLPPFRRPAPVVTPPPDESWVAGRVTDDGGNEVAPSAPPPPGAKRLAPLKPLRVGGEKAPTSPPPPVESSEPPGPRLLTFKQETDNGWVEIDVDAKGRELARRPCATPRSAKKKAAAAEASEDSDEEEGPRKRYEVTLESGSVRWCSPETLLKVVREVGIIVLDPCDDPASIVRPLRSIRLDRGENGLLFDWQALIELELTKKFGPDRAAWPPSVSWKNPPFGEHLAWWGPKIGHEGRANTIASHAHLSIVPARTGTEWFEEFWTADLICFWGCEGQRRLRFIDGETGKPTKNSATFDAAIACWAKTYEMQERFERAFEPYGKIIRPKA